MKETDLRFRMSLGVVLLLVGSIIVISKYPNQTFNANTFLNEPIKVEGFSDQQSKGKNEPVRIIIPDISIDLEVKKARIVDGYWEVFDNLAGWGEGSSRPGEIGNQVIFAHAKEGLFLPLTGIRKEMSIFILTKSSNSGENDSPGLGWYQYNVAEIKHVSPHQTEVIAPSNEEILTLYTCSGFNDSKRLIVVAERDP